MVALDTAVDTDEEGFDPFASEKPEPSLAVVSPAPVAVDPARQCANGGSVETGRSAEAEAFSAAVARMEPGLAVSCRWLETKYGVNVQLPGSGSAADALRQIGAAMKQLSDGTRVYILVQRRKRCQKEEFEVWGGEIWRDPAGSYQREVKT